MDLDLSLDIVDCRYWRLVSLLLSGLAEVYSAGGVQRLPQDSVLWEISSVFRAAQAATLFGRVRDSVHLSLFVTAWKWRLKCVSTTRKKHRTRSIIRFSCATEQYIAR